MELHRKVLTKVYLNINGKISACQLFHCCRLSVKPVQEGPRCKWSHIDYIQHLMNKTCHCHVCLCLCSSVWGNSFPCYLQCKKKISKVKVKWSEVTFSQVWWTILGIRALQLTHPKCTHTAVNTHTHTVNTHPEQWAAIHDAAPGEQLGPWYQLST